MIKISMIVAALSFFILISSSSVFAQGSTPTVCCEKTISGLYCQDVPAAQCDPNPNVRQVPTSCKATSYCKPGTCFDSNEGTCLDNTPQNVCNLNNGIWTDQAAPQCELGCCILGDQAAFVTLTRCKKLSADLGLETNYKKDIKSESTCVASVLGQEKGACVFESEFQKTCRFITRAECAGGLFGNRTKGDFFVGKLCSAEELGTICGPTTSTICAPGKEEVYFVDSCGNTANIYDASKVNDKEYWTNVKDKSEACNPNAANAGSASCGNCNYLLGSFCRATTRGTNQATYGTNICADLNCKNTQNGNNYKHGESWCVYEDAGKAGVSDNSVGSRFYKHICINGEEVLEACADFRQHECIEGSINYTGGTFSQAACRVNRWQDCTEQKTKDNCENTDKRDCTWTKVAGIDFDDDPNGLCLPKNSPGLTFWEGEEAKTVCGQATVKCEATATKKPYSIKAGEREWDWEGDCVDSDGDLDMNWINSRMAACNSLGDCGLKTNWIGELGYKDSIKDFIKVED